MEAEANLAFIAEQLSRQIEENQASDEPVLQSWLPPPTGTEQCAPCDLDDAVEGPQNPNSFLESAAALASLADELGLQMEEGVQHNQDEFAPLPLGPPENPLDPSNYLQQEPTEEIDATDETTTA